MCGFYLAVNSKGRFKINKNGPYDAYMEFLYRMKTDTKLDSAYSYNSKKKEKIDKTKGTQ